MYAFTACCITGTLMVPSNSSAGNATSSRAVPLPENEAACNEVCSVCSGIAHLLADDDDPVHGTSDRAADVDQMTLGVDLLDAEMRLRVVLGAEVAGHALALDDARGIGARANRARTTMLGVTVRVRTAAGLVPLHDALEAAAFAGARDLHRLADFEDVDAEGVAELERGDLELGVAFAVEAHAAHDAGRRVETRLLGVPDFRARGAAAAGDALVLGIGGTRNGPRFTAHAQLHRGVARLRLVDDAEHAIRLGRDHRHRNLLPLVVEDLGHAQLSANQSTHCVLLHFDLDVDARRE